MQYFALCQGQRYAGPLGQCENWLLSILLCEAPLTMWLYTFSPTSILTTERLRIAVSSLMTSPRSTCYL